MRGPDNSRNLRHSVVATIFKLVLTGVGGVWAPPPGSATGYTTQAVSIELSQCSNTFSGPVVSSWLNHDHFCIVLYTSGPVSLKERLLYTLNKLFVKQVKSFRLLLDLDPFILQCSLHNIKYIKFTSP